MEKRTVLFVDDDEIILRSLERGLLHETYGKHFAKSGEEALEILQREEVHVIVTDMIMPGLDGLELLKIVGEKYPHIVKMVLSGSVRTHDLMAAIREEDVFKFIAKPWQLYEGLRLIIREAIDHYNLQIDREDIVGELAQRSGQ
ncbi:MAG: response regulator [Planctomycetota bacterium]|jgi:DNA-binding NtrC family response regulator